MPKGVEHKLYQRHSLWTACGVTLALISFVAGTSLACLQRGTGSVAVEECCQKHCRHAMTGETAAKCCQEPQAKVFQALPASSQVKTISLVTYTLHASLILPVVLQSSGRFLVRFTTGERPPPSLPLYTLHCVLLI